jgi:hypothetical protein
MKRMLPAMPAEFIELDPVGIVPPVLLCGVVSGLALITLQCNHWPDIFSLGSHSTLPTFSHLIVERIKIPAFY